MGEYVAGAYLKLLLDCDVVDYNVRPKTIGLKGLAEFDVVGLSFENNESFVCEVATHLEGVNYGGNKVTLEKIKKKHERMQWFAETHLQEFDNIHLMFWAPVVARGYLTERLADIQDIEIIINGNYAKCIEELRCLAQKTTRDIGNPFFRSLQILVHLRK